jgi:hypothetical protein
MKSRLEFNANWPVRDDYLLELGRMVCVWGSLESYMVIAINKLAGYQAAMDLRGAIMMAHCNFQQRVDIVETLCEQFSGSYPNLQNYKKVIKQIRAAQQGRNKYAHNALSPQEDGSTMISFLSARGTLKTTVEVVRINGIKEVTAKIHEALCGLHSLITAAERAPMWER